MWGGFWEGNEGFWDDFVAIFSFCTESRGSLKTPLLVVLEGLSRLSEDRKIKENSLKISEKFEVQLGAPLGIDFSWILMDFGGLVGTEDATKIA